MADLPHGLSVFAKTLGLKRNVIKRMEKIIRKKFGNTPDHYAIPRLVNNIKVNTLVYHDRYDEMVHFTQAEAITENWSYAHFVPTEGSRTSRGLDQPSNHS